MVTPGTSSARRQPRLDLEGPVRVSALVLALLAGAGAYAYAGAPMDRAAALAEARLLAQGEHEVRHPAGGTLVRIVAREGQEIMAGEPVAVLDTTPIDLHIAELKAQSEILNHQLELVRKEVQSFVGRTVNGEDNRSIVAELELQVAGLEHDAAAVLGRISAAERQLAAMEIRAAIGGVVSWVSSTPAGSTLAASGAVARIAPHPERLVVEASVPRAAAEKLRAGMTMNVWLDAVSWLEGRPGRASIVWIGLDEAAGETERVPVRLELPSKRTALARRIATIPGFAGGLVLSDGQRTLAGQLLEPVLRNFKRRAEARREGDDT